ncbi:ABC transporter permease [Halomonas sp. 18H]|uniref:ABC transporter permease n=1 Tax=Halomonas almeriensis TaxID=308163 RepID=UPI00222F2256|nr:MULTISPECIES: ABC transporter permease [Halomonas]MCW4149861.1 ABC transporter permease [Halomonas sp. 18H]MDN3553178.1 ABC transporter permease [Halomonas almeriensis]
MRYITSRLLFYFVAFLIAISFNFLLPRIMPGDPVDALFAGAAGQLDPSQMDAISAMYGFSDGPLWSQYLQYVKSVFTGDLGPSFLMYPTEVTSVLGFTFPWTLFLIGLGVTTAIILGLIIGTLAAYKRASWLATVIPIMTAVISSMPAVVTALLVFYIFGLQLEWFPMSYAADPSLSPGWTAEYMASVAHHAVLPLLVIVLVSLAQWVMTMRNAMINVLGEDIITMAEAKGLSQSRIMMRYASRNAVLPVVTSVAMGLGFAVAGQVFIEIVFNYPGVGNTLLKAINARDYPLVQALLLLIVAFVLIGNFIADLTYLWLDPRLRK